MDHVLHCVRAEWAEGGVRAPLEPEFVSGREGAAERLEHLFGSVVSQAMGRGSERRVKEVSAEVLSRHELEGGVRLVIGVGFPCLDACEPGLVAVSGAPSYFCPWGVVGWGG